MVDTLECSNSQKSLSSTTTYRKQRKQWILSCYIQKCVYRIAIHNGFIQIGVSIRAVTFYHGMMQMYFSFIF